MSNTTQYADPAAHFESPHRVLNDATLSLPEKADILRTWEENALALQRAASEGMGGGESSRLREVCDARQELEAKQRRAASKQRVARHLGALAFSASVATLLWWIGGPALATIGLIGTYLVVTLWRPKANLA